MSSKKLRRVGLPQELCDRLSRHQIVNCQVKIYVFLDTFYVQINFKFALITVKLGS